jgi:hypothetical protein
MAKFEKNNAKKVKKKTKNFDLLDLDEDNDINEYMSELGLKQYSRNNESFDHY